MLTTIVLLAAGCHTAEAPSPTLPGATAARAPGDTRPNVIVIVADDLGWADTTLYDPGGVPTPHLDTLADRGTRLTSGYVAAPTCGPSRASIMTGRYPQRFGFEFNLGGGPILPAGGLDPAETTIADVLAAEGYPTSMVGKWHLGMHDIHHPMARGFDDFYGLLDGQTPYIDDSLPGVVVGAANGDWQEQTRRTDRTAIVHGFPSTVVHDFGTYLTDDLTARAVEVIDGAAAGDPFFLYLAYTAPHTPFQTTQEYYDRFPDIQDHDKRIYAAMISALDDGIGQVVDALDRNGIADDTLVVFLSDNGCALYTGVCRCEPVRGGKAGHLEGGIRIPFVVVWPGHVPAMATYDGLTSAMDVMATAAAAAGADVTGLELDGVDLVPHLDGSDSSDPHDALFWRSGGQRTARIGDFKLWTSWRDAFANLFDLFADPLELTDLRPDEPEIAEELVEDWLAWNQAMVPPAWPSSRSAVSDQCGSPVFADP